MAKLDRNKDPVGLQTRSILKGHSGALSPAERYKWAIAFGGQIKAAIYGKSASGFFPRGSVGHFLHSTGAGRLKEICDYYSRNDIQHIMYKYAAGRKIAFLRNFQPKYERITAPEDILPLTLCTLFEGGKCWPSLHGTISRYGMKKGRICDVVIEIDYKAGWKKCFEMTRPVVDMLQERDAVFRLKFSGHCSVHIIIPAEALQIEGFMVDHSKFFRCLSDLVKRKLREPRYLDMSFHTHDHFLRLAYSINENTGLVSLPFDVDGYDRFSPDQARPDRVMPLTGWWPIPKNAPGRMEDFIKYVMRGQVALSDKATIILMPGEATQRWQVDRRLVQQARQQKRQAAREFLPNEGFYDRMLRIGQDMIDLREFLLLEHRDSKIALKTLRRLYNTGHEISLSAISKRFDVDESDLELLWNWELRDRAFRYYARDDIKQAIYALAEGRKIRVGNEDKLVFLQEPADILPLIVYSHLSNGGVRGEYPTVCFTNSRYERTGEIPISCDLKIEFSTKTEDESVIEAATPVISLLVGFDVTFFMFFDGLRGLDIMIPCEAFPAGHKLASIRHENFVNQLSPFLKRSMRMPGAACTIVRDPHALSLMPYAIHPQTGLACVPIQFSHLRSFSRRDAWLGNVQVDNEWWNIPEDASVATVNFLKQLAPADVFC